MAALIGLGLATEWIEMSIWLRQKRLPMVSVLRPSGLKLFTRGHPNSRITGLGLATEWIEMVQGISINSLLPGLGLATEWIEI